MAKAIVEWAFQEGLTSAKHRDQTVDYVAKGQHIFAAHNASYAKHSPGSASVNITVTNVGIGLHPYNPLKSVYDELHLIWQTMAGSDSQTSPPNDTATAPDLEYSLDAGASWNLAVSALAFPVANYASLCAGMFLATTNLKQGYQIVPLGPIVAPTWLAIRLVNGSATGQGGTFYEACMSWQVEGLLVNSTYTPF